MNPQVVDVQVRLYLQHDCLEFCRLLDLNQLLYTNTIMLEDDENILLTYKASPLENGTLDSINVLSYWLGQPRWYLPLSTATSFFSSKFSYQTRSRLTCAISVWEKVCGLAVEQFLSLPTNVVFQWRVEVIDKAAAHFPLTFKISALTYSRNDSTTSRVAMPITDPNDNREFISMVDEKQSMPGWRKNQKVCNGRFSLSDCSQK